MRDDRRALALAACRPGVGITAVTGSPRLARAHRLALSVTRSCGAAVRRLRRTGWADGRGGAVPTGSPQPAEEDADDPREDVAYHAPAAADIVGLHGLTIGGRLLLWEAKTDRAWYADDGEPFVHGRRRPCPLCGLVFDSCGECGHAGLHDPCIGHLAGVANACCGHDDVSSAYISWEDGSAARDRKALRVMARLGRRRPKRRWFRWPLMLTRSRAVLPLSVAAARLAAASNLHADPGLLGALSQEWQPQVRAAAAANPSLPLHALRALSQDPEPGVAEAAQGALSARWPNLDR